MAFVAIPPSHHPLLKLLQNPFSKSRTIPIHSLSKLRTRHFRRFTGVFAGFLPGEFPPSLSGGGGGGEESDSFSLFSHDAAKLFDGFFGKGEGLLYTLSDAAEKQSGDWFSGITYVLEVVLKILKDGLSAVHVPYSYGFAIILLTVIVKAATFPLTKRQVESTMAIRTLQPQVKALQKRFAGDQERIQLETARLYKLAGINPFAGLIPTLATIPIWIGLYRALSNVANEGLLTEGFFWIPSLSGPTTIGARQNGSGTSWLFPSVDGHPPLGWSETVAYLVLPLLLVVTQYISVQVMQPSQVNDQNQKASQALTKFLPLLIGYFALSVPSGLSLYWLTSNILSTAQQVWLQKLGGARNPVEKFDSEMTFEEKVKPPKSSIQEKASDQVRSFPQQSESKSQVQQQGERFKQIKEQEARSRKLREEEEGKSRDVDSEKKVSIKGSQSLDINEAPQQESLRHNAISCNSNDVDHMEPNGQLRILHLDKKESSVSGVDNLGDNGRIVPDANNAKKSIQLLQKEEISEGNSMATVESQPSERRESPKKTETE